MKRFLLLLTIFAAINANAAWLTNIPVDATQPDGTVLNLFATGDEYHNRVHDADGYTLVRNAAGWVVYAQLDADGNLAPTNIVYGQSSNIRRARQAAAQAQGIAPNIDIAPERWMQLREEFHNRVSEYESADEVGARGPQRAPTATTRRTGTMNNIVIYISFPDAPSFSHTHSSIETLYNSTVAGASLKSYYRDISNNEFNINSTFYPLQSGSTIISFTAPNPRSYYMIDNTGTGATIEQTLMAQALTYCKPQIEAAFPDAAALDYDNNNYVDNVNFVIQGNPGAWSTLLWPHKWSLYLQNVSLRGKRVYEYNLLMENHFFSASNGKQSVLVHETYHTLSAPDLYTYNGDGASGVPVNTWDVMAQNNGTPQSSTAYITARYGHFITDDEIREITASGTYTIYDIWDRAHNASHPIAYKITSPTSTRDEYYVIEYRRKGGMLGGVYDNGIPGAGIVISRIAPNTNGNSNGKGTDANPYGVYVVRPNGTSSSGGTINDAHFSQQTGRTTFSDFSNPAAFLNNGSPGLDGIVIDQISASGGETMTFRVTFPSAGVPVATDASNVKINSFTANWNPTTNTQSYQISVYRKDGGNKVSIQNYNVGNAVSFKVEGLDYMASKIWYYTVKGVSGGTPSAESNEITVNCDEHSPAFPYQPTFATNDYWNLENGTQTNKWYTGSTNGLYISNDNGASNAYTFNTTSYVYAIRTLKLLQAGKLTVSFNWRAKGETSAYDVLRAFLVPVGINANLNDGDANGMTGTTNTIPNGWIDVGGGILWNKDTYQQATTTLDITNPDYYNLVFFWKNDAVGGTQPPASVTNLKVSFLTTPTALPATQIKYTSFQANWTAVESANQYIVTVTDTLGNPHTGSPYTANTNYITISNIVDRKKYIYTVQAVDAVGAVSDISNSISVVYSNVPAPVATVATHVEYTSFQANWNAVPNAKQYEVYIKLNGTDLLNVIANTNSYTLINITTRGTYSYTIIAVDSVNNKSVPSNEISVVYTNVSAPVATAYSDTTYTSFKANWNDTTTNASSVKHYLLTLIKDSTEIVYDSIKIEKPNTSYEFVNINKRGLYTYRVSIVDIQGNVSLPSNEISIFYPDVPAPVAAEVIPADTTYTSFTARWNAVNVNNHDVSNHFLLTVKDGNGNIFLSYDSLDVGNVNEYTVTGIEKRGSYTFSVIAVDVVDNTSVSSNEISITYPDVPAPVAYNVAAADSAYTHFTARWSAINAAKHYIITVHRGDSVIADYPKTVNTNSHTVTGITLRGSYTFNVVAEDNYGNFSAQSNPGGIFYRDVPAPAIQPATQVRYTSFQANWNALPEAAQYKLTIKKDSAELANPSQPITITQNYYLLGNIVERGVYTYSVMAIDVAGNVSPQSAEASVIYPKIATPVATDATEIQHTSFQANWNTVANVNYYLLTVKDSLNNLIRDAVNADKATSYTVNNITKRGRYTYYVVAVDSAGNRSPQSNVISIVYSDIDSPVATAATDTTTSSFTANWQNNVSVANHYIINVTKKKTVVVTETPHTTVAEWTFANNPGNMKPDAYSENNANQLLTANALGGITMVSGASSYAASATGWYLATLPEMRYWQIDVNTVGFNNLTISSKQTGYYSSPKNFKIQ
ncbi:MAG: M6 family metalloprotease domain-containing protein, partial [Paludibacter sp.]|nr:M6 family metalloprotease domain-containing protein [Paludibacter sp.]